MLLLMQLVLALLLLLLLLMLHCCFSFHVVIDSIPSLYLLWLLLLLMLPLFWLFILAVSVCVSVAMLVSHTIVDFTLTVVASAHVVPVALFVNLFSLFGAVILKLDC